MTPRRRAFGLAIETPIVASLATMETTMGMDVYGRKPTTEAGEYFRRNMWGWRPLAEFVIEKAPEIARYCQHWHSNDGDGLNAAKSRELAGVLRRMVASGEAAEYVTLRDAKLKALPRETCECCDGTGIRTDAIGVEMKMPELIVSRKNGNEQNPRLGQTGWCNGCGGWGSREPTAAWYRLDVNDLTEFAEFLEGCGGFKIN